MMLSDGGDRQTEAQPHDASISSELEGPPDGTMAARKQRSITIDAHLLLICHHSDPERPFQSPGNFIFEGRIVHLLLRVMELR
jgi:hypothetical protein